MTQVQGLSLSGTKPALVVVNNLMGLLSHRKACTQTLPAGALSHGSYLHAGAQATEIERHNLEVALHALKL